MPIVDRDYKSSWDLCYGAKFRRPIVLPSAQRTCRLLKGSLGKTLFLYCGYAYTYECVNAETTEAFLVDPSAGIQGLKNLEDEVDSSEYCVVPELIQDLDPTDASDRQVIRDAGPFDSVIVDYPTMNWLTNQEINQLMNEIRNNLLAAEGTIYAVVKVLYEGVDEETQDPTLSTPGTGLEGWNWKGITEWQDLLPDVRVIPYGGVS